MNQSLTPHSIQHGISSFCINTPDFKDTKCNLNLPSYHQNCLEFEIFILGQINLTCILSSDSATFHAQSGMNYHSHWWFWDQNALILLMTMVGICMVWSNVTKSLNICFLRNHIQSWNLLGHDKKYYVPAIEETSNFIFRKMVYTIICSCAAIIFS